MKPVRVLFVGWDGAEPALVEPWVREGRLPLLAGLVARGAIGRIASTVPAVTPPAWTSLVTGVDPGRHGIYSFTSPSADAYAEHFVSAAERQAPSVWHYLSAAGRRVGVFNLSLSYPPEPVSGFLFAGFDCPVLGPHIAYPEGAFAAALQGVPGYVHEGPGEVRGEAAARQIVRQMRQQVEMLGNLTRQYPVEVLAVNFNGPDHIHHHGWPRGQSAEELARSRGSVVEEVYRELDGLLGELLEAYADEETQVVLASDHGGGVMRGQVSLAQALEEGGFLVRRETSRRAERGGVRELAHRLLPARAKAWVWSRKGLALRQELARRRQAALTEGVDWSRTRAFPWGSSGFVQVNVQGRQPQGCVAPEDRERVLGEVEAYLRELREPETGAAVLDKIARGEALYREPRAGYAPDLVVEDTEYAVLPHWGSGDTLPNSPAAGELGKVSPGITANHRPEGVLVTRGPAVRAGAVVPRLGMADLAPALLYLAGVAIPEGLDGRLARELWDTGVVPEGQEAEPAAAAPAAAVPYSEQEQAAVEARLRDLGYM